MKAPSHCPPYGLTLPVRFERARDGDTIEVRLQGSGPVWAIRLIECWCPELRSGPQRLRDLAAQARAFATSVLEEAPNDLRLYLPAPELPHEGLDGFNLLSLVTFDRIPGHIYVGPTQTLNRMMVEHGHASSFKGGELGK